MLLPMPGTCWMLLGIIVSIGSCKLQQRHGRTTIGTDTIQIIALLTELMGFTIEVGVPILGS